MCALNLQKNEAADTDIVFGPLCDVAKLLRGYIPCGKVALIADGESNFPAVQTIRAALKGFECFCVVAGEGDNASGLFSLPDDVRAAIAVGKGAFCAARYFCTLRGAYCIVVPDHADLSAAFENPVRLFVSGGFSRYPADAPDAVYCDLSRIGSYDAAYGKLCLCALSAFDCEAHSVFAGGGDASAPYHRFFEDAVRLADFTGQNFQRELLSLSADLALFLSRRKKRTAAEIFSRLLCKKCGCTGGSAALFSFCYLLERYRHFFQAAKPRAFYVPDYARRIRIAAAYAGEDERALFLKNKVPTAKRTDALAEVFTESRAVFCRKAQSVAVYTERVKSGLYALGAKAPAIDAVRAHEAFSAAAELSDMLSVPALMRDFGLLT